jgi:hypothetical protein
MPTTVVACIQEIPPDASGTHALAMRDLSASAEDYLSAVEKAEAQVPEGWRVIYVRTDAAPATDNSGPHPPEPGSPA